MDKRKFLYYNLYKIEKNKRILLINYIDKNEIEHSENSNGVLLNLSLLDDKHINFIYDLYNIENKYSNHNKIEIKMTQVKKKEEKKSEYKDCELNSLEKLILSYSY